jgi:hypothetical protein
MERSQGGGLDKIRGNITGGDEIGSDTTSSAQLRDGGNGEVIQTGSGVVTGCGNVCELASCIPRGVVWRIALAVHSASSVVGCIVGAST